MTQFVFDVLNEMIDEPIGVFEPGSDEQIAELKIKKVERSLAHGNEFDAFTVELSGDAREHCPPATYLFKHPKFGEESLYMSPYAIDQYQICISRKADNS
ncbi:hypothetical protein JYB88_00665 [Shewanella cyperi]|uniref:DUF6916 domain-containing protein n=1 Tax=Shewanella cyperi TaxID=2814292 RepID=A0A975AKY8_9GAMM|nr:hypothetical protein [Shewanella cyperi]QSX30226.1 hypothetical protein JYB88_00665 [Shewanella cyperi]